MCLLHFKLSEIYIHESLKTLTVGILVLLINRSIGSNGLFFLIVGTLHLLGSKSSFLVFIHL